jgi:hypothetical protein
LQFATCTVTVHMANCKWRKTIFFVVATHDLRNIKWLKNAKRLMIAPPPPLHSLHARFLRSSSVALIDFLDLNRGCIKLTNGSWPERKILLVQVEKVWELVYVSIRFCSQKYPNPSSPCLELDS